MRAFEQPRSVSMTLNLAPMVDVMMCLIIFFLLVGKLVKHEHRPMPLANAIGAENVDAGQLGARVVMVVRPSDADPLRPEFVVTGWDGRRITENVLAADGVSAFLKSQAEAAGARGEVLRCVIRAHREVSYAAIETVLRGCGLANIKHIVFGVEAGAGSAGGGA